MNLKEPYDCWLIKWKSDVLGNYCLLSKKSERIWLRGPCPEWMSMTSNCSFSLSLVLNKIGLKSCLKMAPLLPIKVTLSQWGRILFQQASTLMPWPWFTETGHRLIKKGLTYIWRIFYSMVWAMQFPGCSQIEGCGAWMKCKDEFWGLFRGNHCMNMADYTNVYQLTEKRVSFFHPKGGE